MKARLRPRCAIAAGSLTLVVMGALVVAGSLADPALAETGDSPRRDPPRRDQFGLVPEEPRDEDLSLPDPVLDRTWSGPKPGEVRRAPGSDEPQGDADRPSIDGQPAPRAGRRAKDGDGTRPPKAAVIGPDGRRDPGSPAPEIDPDLPDVLDRDAPDLSGLDPGDEARPSPRDRGGEFPADDAGDPGDFEDSGDAGE